MHENHYQIPTTSIQRRGNTTTLRWHAADVDEDTFANLDVLTSEEPPAWFEVRRSN